MFDANMAADFAARYAETIVGLLGVELVDFSADTLTAEMTVRQLALNSQGFLHGGVSPFVAETLASFGSLYPRRETHRVAGVSVSANHLRPARLGDRVTFLMRPHRCGGRLHVWSVEMRNSLGEPLSVAQVTVAVDSRKVDKKSSSPGTDSRVS
ncbi:MAG: PaaI family thioesterase [Planctomycetaceae bacterium]|nr:PaaI family thioesterase [Planctomycetaceae bacterium]